MTKAKKVISKIISGGFEAVADSAKQIGETVSPGSLLEQALGQQKSRKGQESEFTKYLKSLGPNLSEEELERKKREFSSEEEQGIMEAKKKIRAAIPAHMRPPPRRPEKRPHEVNIEEEEKKKAMAVEAQKKQPQPLVTPAGSSKQPGLHRMGKKRQPKGFEGLAKDTKTG